MPEESNFNDTLQRVPEPFPPIEVNSTREDVPLIDDIDLGLAEPGDYYRLAQYQEQVGVNADIFRENRLNARFVFGEETEPPPIYSSYQQVERPVWRGWTPGRSGDWERGGIGYSRFSNAIFHYDYEDWVLSARNKERQKEITEKTMRKSPGLPKI